MTLRRHVLVDASNVAMCGPWREVHGDDRELLQRRLVDAGASWAGALGAAMVLVFDGVGPIGGVGERAIGGELAVRVVATGAQTADEWIEREARAVHRTGDTVWVVSSDGGVRRATAAAAQLQILSEDFARELLSAFAAAQEQEGADRPDDPPPAAPGGDGSTRLDASLGDATRDALERIRRGHAQ